METLKWLRDGLLERKREIEAQIKEIGKATSSTLREEKRRLKAELQEGLEKQKVWVVQLAEIKSKQAELQNGSLKNAQVQDRWPWTANSSTTRNSTPSISPMKENIPQSPTSTQPAASTSSILGHIKPPQLELPDLDEEDIFQHLDSNIIDDAGHWLLPSLDFDLEGANTLIGLPSFEEFNHEFMGIPEEEGGPTLDMDVFLPSGAPTTQLQQFQVDKE